MRNRFTGAAIIFLLFCGMPIAAAAVLSLSGPGSPVAVGSSFTIDVNISDVTDLAGYQFDIGYNPALIGGISVQEGPFLMTAGNSLFVPGTIDDASGTISFTAAALVGMGPGATGNGVLVTLQFSGLAVGVANFELISPLLYDSIPNAIDVTANGTSVTLAEGTAPIPEPRTTALLGAALAVLAILRKRKRAV